MKLQQKKGISSLLQHLNKFKIKLSILPYLYQYIVDSESNEKLLRNFLDDNNKLSKNIMVSQISYRRYQFSKKNKETQLTEPTENQELYIKKLNNYLNKKFKTNFNQILSQKQLRNNYVVQVSKIFDSVYDLLFRMKQVETYEDNYPVVDLKRTRNTISYNGIISKFSEKYKDTILKYINRKKLVIKDDLIVRQLKKYFNYMRKDPNMQESRFYRYGDKQDVKWSEKDWENFYYALKKYDHYALANQKIAKYMGKHIQPNHVRYIRQKVKKDERQEIKQLKEKEKLEKQKDQQVEKPLKLQKPQKEHKEEKRKEKQTNDSTISSQNIKYNTRQRRKLLESQDQDKSSSRKQREANEEEQKVELSSEQSEEEDELDLDVIKGD